MSKAEARCKCERCGKEFVMIAFKQNREQARSFEAWAVENCTVCFDCRKKEKDKKADMVLASFGYIPELSGTSKQVAWAKKLRSQVIARTWDYVESQSAVINKEKVRIFLGWVIANKKDARFWIDSRDKESDIFLLQDEALAEEFAQAESTIG